MPNYVQHFGSNIVEGVVESWVEDEMSWVEVDGAGWRLKWARWRWMELGEGWNELGGGGWSWVEVGAQLSNTHHKTVTTFMISTRLIYQFWGNDLHSISTTPPKILWKSLNVYKINLMISSTLPKCNIIHEYLRNLTK